MVSSNKRKVPPTAGPDAKRSKKSPSVGAKTKGNKQNQQQQATRNEKTKSDTKNTKNKSRAAPAARAVFDASALGWQSVGEDFGALQVLSGVDVVKHGDKVQFIVKDEDATKATPVATENQAESEAFQGFSDDDVDAQGLDSDANSHAKAKGAVESTKEQAVSVATKSETAAGDMDKNKNKNKDRAPKKKKGPSDGEKGEAAKTDEVAEVVDQSAKSAVASSKKSKSQKLGDQKKVLTKSSSSSSVPSSSSQAQGNAFSALAALEDDKAEGEDLDMTEWVALNLSPSLVSAIAKLGFAKPTAIQQKSIPEIVAGGDVIGKAQTGIRQNACIRYPHYRTKTNKPKAPLAVILSPTRELAKQIGEHIKAVCDGLPASSPYVCVVTGGLSIQKQQRQLQKADIVIGTPGRLWEVLDGDASLQEQFTKIQFLVIDEADRLFKVGQFKEAEDIIGALDRQTPEAGYSDSSSDAGSDAGGNKSRDRQTLVFSATFDKDLQTKLAGKASKASKSGGSGGPADDQMAYLMKCLKFRGEPKFIDVNPIGRMAAKLREGLIECGAMEKDLYLYTVLLLNPGRRTLVFTNSISAVRRLTPLLQNLNQNALPLHSQMIQKARLRSLEKFTASRNAILVATDVAARGLDIKDVDQVLHYHVPRAADAYIHRSGRTARADRSGVSILLCSPDEVLPTRRLAGKVHARRSAKAAGAGNSSSSSSNSKDRDHMIESLPIDRKIASRLRPRLDLAKKITDAALAKEKAHSNDAWLRNAAEELGVEYDSEEFEATEASGWAGGSRGGGRRRKEKEATALTKAEMGALKAQLRHELSQRVNLGVSEKYITGGRVDIAQLLKQRDESVGGIFLGGDHLGLGLGL
ncbi:related to ATP-dependent RNA helicase [Claviceps purpurea 20.1]|uniref:RNA helicase n=1 Tax=Claviceps purpurea (strain 20.1) TaxID=1111077 RepID=M1W0M8_CLAP2|nr:related to ATP-dependent RNA helicase [Claviceps purpurea 20.1]